MEDAGGGDAPVWVQSQQPSADLVGAPAPSLSAEFQGGIDHVRLRGVWMRADLMRAVHEAVGSFGLVALEPLVAGLIFLGPPGVGKTHLAISLAIAAAQSGRRVYYGALADLITSLEEAKTAGQLGRRLKILTYPSLLVIDEIGYLPVSQTGAMLFFQLINRRYERASTVLTSNKGFEEWGQILGDEVMAAALIDRLLHHCHIVNIRGSSYRMRKHIDLSKILHSPPAEPSPLPPKRKRARAKEKSTN